MVFDNSSALLVGCALLGFLLGVIWVTGILIRRENERDALRSRMSNSGASSRSILQVPDNDPPAGYRELVTELQMEANRRLVREYHYQFSDGLPDTWTEDIQVRRN
jgi:hypothetical protein